MIQSITIKGFKSLADVTLELGPLNIFVGTNSSGRSNFFDALRVLQGIGLGFTISEILNGKPKGAGGDVWEPIRGGSANAAHLRRDTETGASIPTSVRIEAVLRVPDLADRPMYSVGFDPMKGWVTHEKLLTLDKPVFDSDVEANDPAERTLCVRYYREGLGREPLRFDKSRPVLHQLLSRRECSEEHRELLSSSVRALSDMQRLEPDLSVLRDYSLFQAVSRMGERGENFAALVNAILSDKASGEAYLSWLRQRTPAEIEYVEILPGARQDVLFAVVNRIGTFSAPVLSDGTLRFAAIAAAFFQSDMPDTLTIEEIENGIHPTRLRLLVELLKSRAQRPAPQVVASTHSPVVLAWLDEADYRTTFFCQRDEETGASQIRPLSEVPGFLELVRKQPVSELFAEGWLEGAL